MVVNTAPEAVITVAPVRTSRVPRMFGALTEVNFRTFVLGMVFCYLCMTIQGVMQGYLAYSLTGRGTDLGIISLSFGLPMLLFTLVAGVAADRFERRSILFGTQFFLGAVTLVLAVLVHTGLITMLLLFVLALLQGVAIAFNLPARNGMIPDVVSERNLSTAVALNNSFFNFCRIFGPALAGLLIAVPNFGIAGVYYLMAASYFISAVLLLRLKVQNRKVERLAASMGRQILDGLQHIWSTKTLFYMMAMAFIVVLLGMPHQLVLPVFAVDVLNVGSAGLGLLFAMAGIGALIGSLSLAAFADSKKRGIIQVAAAALFGLMLVGFALSPWFGLSLALMLMVGLLSNLYMSLNNTVLLLETKREYVGRVMSVYMLTFALMPVTTLPMGAATDAFGAPISVAVSGLALTVLSLLLGYVAYRKGALSN